MNFLANTQIRRTFIILIISILFVSCSSDNESPEQQIKNSLKAMEIAAQERSRSDFMKYVSDDYFDAHGNDKKAVMGLLQLLFLRNQKIHIFTLIRSIEVNQGIAKVELATAMTSRDIDLSQESNRLKADTQRFTISMKQKKNTDLWLVESASWERGW